MFYSEKRTPFYQRNSSLCEPRSRSGHFEDNVLVLQRGVQSQHRLHYAGSLIKWTYRKHIKGESVPLCYKLPLHSHRDSTNNVSKCCCNISTETPVLRITASVTVVLATTVLLSTGKPATTVRNLSNILSNARSSDILDCFSTFCNIEFTTISLNKAFASPTRGHTRISITPGPVQQYINYKLCMFRIRAVRNT